MSVQIKFAYENLDEVRALFTEYQVNIGLDLCFQSFDEELETLPGNYALPFGRLYIATLSNEIAGCIALRPVDKQCCEMKRLYVREQFRGFGIGRTLSEKIIGDAKKIGYKKMVLDTLTSMQKAVSLYKSLGFMEIEPYYNNPNHDVVFLGLDIRTV